MQIFLVYTAKHLDNQVEYWGQHTMKYKTGSRSYTSNILQMSSGQTKQMHRQKCGVLLSKKQEQLLSNRTVEVEKKAHGHK